MKQRRSVKSLLPKKTDREGKFLMILLLILSIVLCIGSASLMTGYVGAQDNTPITYTGMDDKVEVLYKVELGDPSNLTRVVNEMYMSGKNLYFTPYAVKEKPNGYYADVNTMGESGYINILGGEGNKVYSDNITMIAGYKNEISGGNDNASILGGRENKILGSSEGGAPAVIVGGSNNVISKNNSNVIVGGYNNEITGASNSTILGGENNKVEGNNAIVGGSGVYVKQNINNVFAFSNATFIPKSSNAFYLNLINGVGINVSSAGTGLSVKGKVLLGNIDIDSVVCNSQNLGVEGVWNVDNNGCLVGCTKESYGEGKWELLDRGGVCEEKCEGNSKCLYEKASEIEVSDYTGFCLDNVSVENASRCTTGGENNYKNVVFQTVLIDEDEVCPGNSKNQCIYKCNTGSHLTGNVAGGDESDVMCFKDCELPWGGTIMHNETVTGYNTNAVSCSNDIYVFPLSTEIINKGNPLWNYSTGTKTKITAYGDVVNYPNRVLDGKSPETCGNYDHKKTLVCLSGTLYLTADDGKTALTETAEEAEKYIYSTSTLKKYRCNTGELHYNLMFKDIKERYLDNLVTAPAEREDRGVVNGERGIYEVCMDYDAYQDETSIPSLDSWSSNIGNQSVKGEACKYWDGETTYNGNNQNAPTEHYQFVGCQSGYATGWYDSENKLVVCKKKCTLYGSNGIYKDGDEVIGYVSSGATCTDTCQSEKLVCNDGTWRIGEYTGVEATGYLYNYCNLSDKICSNYNPNITSSIVETYSITKGGISGHSYYGSCDPYVASGNKVCNPKPRVYKLTGCDTEAPGYHTENWLRCIANTQSTGCIQTGAKGTGYEYINRNIDITWSGTWEIGEWIWPESAKCEWTCASGYHYSTGSQECKPNMQCISCFTGTLPEHAVYNVSNNGDGPCERKYVNGDDVGETTQCPWGCQVGYTLSGNICVEVGSGVCLGEDPRGFDYFGKIVTGSDQGDVYNRYRKAVSLNEISGNEKCLYICGSGYYAIGGKCRPCPEGSTWIGGDNPYCLTETVCPGDNQYLSEDGKYCYDYNGLCEYKDETLSSDDMSELGVSLNVFSPNSYIDIIPPTGIYGLKCLDDGKYPGVKIKNNCTFKCNEGYYCDYNRKGHPYPICNQPRCNWGHAYNGGNEKYYQTGGKAGNYTFNTIYTPEELILLYTGGYVDDDDIPACDNGCKTNGGNDFLTLEEKNFIEEHLKDFINLQNWSNDDFNRLFGKNSGWPIGKCVYWCPIENRITKNNGVYMGGISYSCESTGKVAEVEAEENSIKPYCKDWSDRRSSRGFVLYGYYTYDKGSPLISNQSRMYMDYSDFMNSQHSCNRTCGEGAELISGYRPQTNSEVEGNQNYLANVANAKICYKKCGSDQYLDSNGKCETCGDGKILTGYGLRNIEGKNYSGYRACIDNCPEGSSWDYGSKKCKCDKSGMELSDGVCQCVGGKVWSPNYDKCVCPNGSNYDSGLKKCKCDSDGETLTDEGCKCDKPGWVVDNLGNCVHSSVCTGSSQMCNGQCLTCTAVQVMVDCQCVDMITGT